MEIRRLNAGGAELHGCMYMICTYCDDYGGADPSVKVLHRNLAEMQEPYDNQSYSGELF